MTVVEIITYKMTLKKVVYSRRAVKCIFNWLEDIL